MMALIVFEVICVGFALNLDGHWTRFDLPSSFAPKVAEIGYGLVELEIGTARTGGNWSRCELVDH